MLTSDQNRKINEIVEEFKEAVILFNQMATIGGCINKNIVRTFFQASLNDSFQVFVLNLKLFKGIKLLLKIAQ